MKTSEAGKVGLTKTNLSDHVNFRLYAKPLLKFILKRMNKASLRVVSDILNCVIGKQCPWKG